MTLEEAEKFLESQASIPNLSEVEDRKTQASHRITIEFCATGEELELDGAAELNNMMYGYVLTVHKAQGCEWEKVFFLLHKKHNVMVNRELLYTAITRAKKELCIVCEPDHFVKGILTQSIKGNTLKEKAIFFQGKQKMLEEKQRIKELKLEMQKTTGGIV